jgi:hypothetical protein
MQSHVASRQDTNNRHPAFIRRRALPHAFEGKRNLHGDGVKRRHTDRSNKRLDGSPKTGRIREHLAAALAIEDQVPTGTGGDKPGERREAPPEIAPVYSTASQCTTSPLTFRSASAPRLNPLDSGVTPFDVI